MKVWAQTWLIPEKGQLTSISKTIKDLRKTIKEIEKAEKKEKGKNGERAKVDGDPFEITIPENSPYIEMIEKDTVFLNEDEMNLVYDSL